MPRDICEWVISGVPGPTGDHIRRRYWRPRLRHLGRGTRLDVGVSFTHPDRIWIADGVWIDRYAVITAGPPREGARRLTRRANARYAGVEGDVYIGPGTHVGPFVVLNGHGNLTVEGRSSIATGSAVYSLSHHHRDPSHPSDPTKCFALRPWYLTAIRASLVRPS